MPSKGPSIFQQCSMEFFSCFIIVLTIQNTGTKFYGAFAIAVSFFIGVFIAAKVSGAHLNPAVTLMAYYNDKHKDAYGTKFKNYLYFMIAQLLGSILGALLSDVLGGDTVKPSINNVTLLGAFLAEGFFTFFLCLSVSMIADPHSGTDPAMCGIVVCVLIFITAVSIGPFTSGVVNPAIGMALVLASSIVKGNQDFRAVPLYIIAPLVGGFIAHLTYVKYMKPAMQQDSIRDE